MTELPHDMCDKLLIEDVVKLGCLPVAYTRQQHPGLFDCWEARVFWVRTCAARGASADVADAIAEADLYSGQPFPLRRSPLPHPEIATLDMIELALVGSLTGVTP